MALQVAIIGFGEAAQAFAGDRNWSAPVRAYDKLSNDPARRAGKLADYARLDVRGCDSLGEAIESADLVLSLVTAGEALSAAEAASAHIKRGAVYCDMNSVSPETKRAAASCVSCAGGRYVDVAIMSPAYPARLGAPLLLSGPSALEAEHTLREVGFQDLDTVGPRIGSASAIKMIRSVIVKGIEALTAEALLAADLAGVTEEVLASLDKSESALPWAERASYNLERMMLHGRRRADEMHEAGRTLEALGVEPLLTRGSAARQRQIGALGLQPATSLAERLRQLRLRKADAA